MLVLSRKCQESVVVGGELGGEFSLKVTVVEVGEGKVSLGFEADRKVPVHRWEVWKRIRAENGQAAHRSSPKGIERAGDCPRAENGTGRASKSASLPKTEHVSGSGVGVCATSNAGGRST